MVFRTAPVTRGDLTAMISATGTIQPEELLDVGAAVAGQIVALGTDADGKPIDFGSQVKMGTVLARIDDMMFKATVDSARAVLRRAEAELASAKALQAAVREGEKMDAAKASVAAALAKWQQSKIEFDVARTNLDRTIIKSPIDGVVGVETGTQLVVANWDTL